MSTIIAYTAKPCRQCGTADRNIDQDKTAKNAVMFLGALEKKQVAEKMDISPQYLGDMLADPPRRKWNSEFAVKFESAVNSLKT